MKLSLFQMKAIGRFDKIVNYIFNPYNMSRA
jgi:hypothetical protein